MPIYGRGVAQVVVLLEQRHDLVHVGFVHVGERTGAEGSQGDELEEAIGKTTGPRAALHDAMGRRAIIIIPMSEENRDLNTESYRHV